mmetsp:Transcript_56125/g.89001  ORF Transcript_56125/g.89001 Transcript_56125/m.89001 type:complete len:89 (-) Transcript_56125:42-308(-)
MHPIFSNNTSKAHSLLVLVQPRYGTTLYEKRLTSMLWLLARVSEVGVTSCILLGSSEQQTDNSGTWQQPSLFLLLLEMQLLSTRLPRV